MTGAGAGIPSAALEVQAVGDGGERRSQLAEILQREWGTAEIISRGEVHDVARGPALFCLDGDRVVGLATYAISREECELLTLDALEKTRGVGSRLLEAVIERARVALCRRLWLITTNDNLDAIRFYQRRGMRLVALHPGALDEARLIKPQIPVIGNYGIAIRDELEFELDVAG